MSDYQEVEANGTTLILTESMAIDLYHALAREFHWSGQFFTPEDIRSTINERRENDGKDPLEGEQLEEAVNTIIGSRDWSKWLPDWMCEQGWEVIHTSIFENLEYES